MGERLVFVGKHDNKPVICGYWHWSGYTESALETINKIIISYNATKRYQYDFGTAVRSWCVDEAGFTSDYEHDDVITKYGGQYCVSRNDGIVDTKPEEIEKSIFWANELVEWELGDDHVDISNLFDEYESQYNNCDYEPTVIDLSEFQLTNFPVDKLGMLETIVNDNHDKLVVYKFRGESDNERLVSLISNEILAIPISY